VNACFTCLCQAEQGLSQQYDITLGDSLTLPVFRPPGALGMRPIGSCTELWGTENCWVHRHTTATFNFDPLPLCYLVLLPVLQQLLRLAGARVHCDADVYIVG